MNRNPKPQSINPVEWAAHNARHSALISEMMQSIDIDQQIGCILSQPFLDLEAAITRAVDELQEDGGPRSGRIAVQILSAMARYHVETGT